MGMFGESVEEIWQGVTEDCAYRATRFVGSFPTFAGRASCGAPLALGNASEVKCCQ